MDITEPTPTTGAIALAAKWAIIHELVERPETRLSEISQLLRGNLGQVIGQIRVCELWEARDGGPSSADYDERIVEVVRAASTMSVSPAYVRERVGGPRWRRQAAILRLIDTGRITRTGRTSGTRYWPGEEPG